MKIKLISTILTLITIVSNTTITYATEEESVMQEKKHSAQCKNLDIADAENYAEEVYKDLLRWDAIDYIDSIGMEISKDDIDNLRLGESFIEFNVDGPIYAVVYFPIYKGEDAVGIFTVEYHEKQWHWDDGVDQGKLYWIWNLLDEVDYENKDTIIYTINNMCYVENSDKCVKTEIASMERRDAGRYSMEEEEFMKMSWSEKKEVVRGTLEDMRNICSYTAHGWEEDDDHGKFVTTMKIHENTGEESDFEKIPVFIVFGLTGVILVVCFVIRGKRKSY